MAEVDADIIALKTKLAERDALLAQSRQSAPAAPPPTAAPSKDAELAPEMRTYEAYLEKNPTASLEEYFDARSDARQVLKEQQRDARQREQALTEAQHKRVESFSKRINETATADPAFVEKVSPAVIALRPFIAGPGEKAGPEQVIAEEILSSPVAPQVMVELSNPETLAKLMSMRTPAEIIRAVAQIEARYAPAGDGDAPPIHKLTSTPAPVTTLGKRPTDTVAPSRRFVTAT